MEIEKQAEQQIGAGGAGALAGLNQIKMCSRHVHYDQ